MMGLRWGRVRRALDLQRGVGVKCGLRQASDLQGDEGGAAVG
jgi:hypothetical protein